MSRYTVTPGVEVRDIPNDDGSLLAVEIVVHLADGSQRNLFLEPDDMDAVAVFWRQFRQLRGEHSERGPGGE